MLFSPQNTNATCVSVFIRFIPCLLLKPCHKHRMKTFRPKQRPQLTSSRLEGVNHGTSAGPLISISYLQRPKGKHRDMSLCYQHQKAHKLTYRKKTKPFLVKQVDHTPTLHIVTPLCSKQTWDEGARQLEELILKQGKNGLRG